MAHIGQLVGNVGEAVPIRAIGNVLNLRTRYVAAALAGAIMVSCLAADATPSTQEYQASKQVSTQDSSYMIGRFDTREP